MNEMKPFEATDKAIFHAEVSESLLRAGSGIVASTHATLAVAWAQIANNLMIGRMRA